MSTWTYWFDLLGRVPGHRDAVAGLVGVPEAVGSLCALLPSAGRELQCSILHVLCRADGAQAAAALRSSVDHFHGPLAHTRFCPARGFHPHGMTRLLRRAFAHGATVAIKRDLVHRLDQMHVLRLEELLWLAMSTEPPLRDVALERMPAGDSDNAELARSRAGSCLKLIRDARVNDELERLAGGAPGALARFATGILNYRRSAAYVDGGRPASS